MHSLIPKGQATLKENNYALESLFGCRVFGTRPRDPFRGVGYYSYFGCQGRHAQGLSKRNTMIIIPKPGPPTLPTKLVLGTDQNSAGVTGQSNFGPGVLGQSTGGYSSLANEALDIVSPGTDGVLGEGTNGVRGVSGAEYGDGPAPGGAGVWGTNTNSGPGVYGTSAMGDGVLGSAYHGVHGIFPAGPSGGAGVWGEDKSSAAGGVGVAGTTTNGVGVSGISGSAQSA